MPSLDTNLRRNLENVVVQARDLAEAAARASLRRWAVDAAEPFDHFSGAEKAFRNRLRARGRQAGDRRDEGKKTQGIDRLTEELAYEYWHRMLFARFLAENDLLMHPDGIAVTLAECDELAKSERAPNGFVLAARFASRMLPEIFRTDDVLLEIEFPINDRLPLEKLLASLPVPVFTADDSLGWVYQFWQTKEKKRVNESGQKIDWRTLPAVTQLFTEHYMVEFLLHNTIGAWWCARNGVAGPPGGAGVPEGSPVRLDYLRWKDDGTPAAGAFEGWSKSLKEFTMLDPCCGSGHFLVAGLHLLVPLRRHDDGLSTVDAVDEVLRNNLYGLEIDPRCTQIAAFNLAMAAWKYTDDDGNPLGYRPLPRLNIACSGQPVIGTKDDWVNFSKVEDRAREGMERLYDQFRHAPTLGSLINPRTVADDLFSLGFDALRSVLEVALVRIKGLADPERAAIGVAAQGIALAAWLMARKFTLVATNVPYLARGKQDDILREYIGESHPDAKSDLATAFVERCLDYCSSGGAIALVTPQNWLFLGSYTALRERMLRQVTWDVVAKLGPGAFETITGEVVNVALLIYTATRPEIEHCVVGLDASLSRIPVQKAELLRVAHDDTISQIQQTRNPDARITLSESGDSILLEKFAFAYQGIKTGDDGRFRRVFWETNEHAGRWRYYQSTVENTVNFGGLESIIDWQSNGQDMARLQGMAAWDRRGVAVSQMSHLPTAFYQGGIYDSNVSPIVPSDPAHLPAIWCFCKSAEYHAAVRRIDQSLKVTNAALVKIPFDLERWNQVAAEEYPNGLPEPHSDDPTQWLFKGHPRESTDPLQVAVARLLGYRWPDQEPDDLDLLTDKDGIVPIPAARGESPAADRLHQVLRTAFASESSGAIETRLLGDSGAKSGTTLDEWLRNGFFEQHCKRFLNRPFVWHLSDGISDGFACLVNYHKLDHKLLETLTYSYLRDWINDQAADAKRSKPGADLRLNAAQELQDKLKLILAGEPPYDLFVRWKPLAEQSVGWNPDLNDGVRLNIRPFMTAGVLRKNPNIKWTKDRGNEPKRDQDQSPWFWDGDTFTGERVNDRHYTNAEKQAARDRAK